MTDEELARRLSRAYDAHIAQAETQAPPEPPSLERADRQLLSRAQGPEAQTPALQAVPARRVRRQAAVAAILVLCLLGGGLLLLRRSQYGAVPASTEAASPAAWSEPENCHKLRLPDGEEIWVMDRPYSGDCDLQILAFSTRYETGLYAGQPCLPEGFETQTVMDYEAYAAYCAAFGVQLRYTDREARYLVAAYGLDYVSSAAAQAIDLQISGTEARLFLWDSFTSSTPTPGGYVLTVPVPAQVETLTVEQVFSPGEAETQSLLHSTRITEQGDGSFTISGWAAGRKYGPGIPSQTRCISLWDGPEQIYLLSDSSELDGYESGMHIRAEGCRAVEPPDGAGRWYRAERLELLDLNAAQPVTFGKPVIYLYPDAPTRVRVELELEGELSCSYPAYRGGWELTAEPDGTLVDDAGQRYNYLYWEGESSADFDFSRGFCVRGADTTAFLEEALAKLGLTRREANEFIVYWLPLMQDNPWNLIAFQGTAYTERARLNVTPAPDTLIRVYMAFRPLELPVELPPQVLTALARQGFTVVEWGGSRVD